MEEQTLSTPRSRRGESRAPESRELGERPASTYVGGYSPFDIPQHVKDKYPDMVFMFSRYSFQNSGEDRDNIERKFDELGADIVPAAVASEFVRSHRALRGMRESADEWSEATRRRGHVLLWAPREAYEAERRFYTEWSERQFQNRGTHENLDVVVDDRQLKMVTGGSR